ncbi:fasciclin domain-containing protein [Pseudoalteromonas sp. G4]|uniref:fasciclin domain-containing protein n=1 Tax=Pseudoalteromonas sp. G4 TaxID=2992761 RepID=UPI00237D7CE7|nr:fasciclin domain-containing protein [Pseudoalteromonas sp. G4]MDE3270499.1 fasciclin domain-containing protein [Pseudoalteromonas sp. G4]
MRNLLKSALLVSSMLVVTGCNDDDNNEKVEIPTIPEPSATTVVDVAVNDGNFTTLVAALEATGLDETLANTDGNFTVFAPTDAAFELLPEGTLDALLADTDTLTDILTYHVIGSKVDASAAISSAGSKVEMVNGDYVGLSLDGDSLLVNTVTVTATDIMADNGIIHVIDAVLMPPQDKDMPTSNIVETAVAAGTFNTLVAALQATNLDTVLADESKSYTVFAPTDDAFALLGEETINTLLENTDVLSSILLQHVVVGEVDSVTAYTLNGMEAETASGAKIPVSINSETDSLMFGGAKIITKDIYTTNGIIHVIDAVIVGDVTVPEPVGNIVEVASKAGAFNTLLIAAAAAGLADVLADESATYTVFAPTDAAFAQIPESTLEALLADTEALKNVLLYHVIADEKVMSDGAVAVANSENNKVTMANTQMAALSLSGTDLYINASKVSAANVAANNGVIHVVDQVILPPSIKGEPTQNIVEVAVSNPEFSTLVTALQAANLVDALADETKSYTVFAPTNAAFDKIPDDVLSALLADNTALTNVLLQHVVAAEIDSVSAFAANGKAVDTLANNDVSVDLINYTESTNSESDEVAYDAASQMLVGGNGSDKAGYTLYVFDNDLGQASSTCIDACADAWPPVIVTDEMADNIQGLSIITRADGTKQAAFMGRPLYFFAQDMAAGETKGDGANNVWWKVSLPQVALQIQGANVVTKDIYTTNGVIHVIDTVITETLN